MQNGACVISVNTTCNSTLLSEALLCVPDELNRTVMRNRPVLQAFESLEEQLGTAVADGNKNGTIKLLLHLLVSQSENHQQVVQGVLQQQTQQRKSVMVFSQYHQVCF